MTFKKKKPLTKPTKPGWKKFDPKQLPPVPKYVPKADPNHFISEKEVKEKEPEQPQKVSPPPEPITPKPKSSPRTAKSRPAPKYDDPEKEFVKAFHQLTSGKYNAWEVFKDFVVLFATSLSNPFDKLHFQEREDCYLRIIKKYEPEEQKIFPQLAAHTVMALEKNPDQDFLGNIFMHLDLGNEAKGQIFTPYHVCELMAEITMEDVVKKVKEDGFITIDDPCCGAGATLIAGINKARKALAEADLNFQNHVLISGQDIDETVLLMCYIQVSLLGVAGYFKHGNSLTEPMTDGDSLENYWFTPMYYSDVWYMRRIVQHAKELMEGKDE